MNLDAFLDDLFVRGVALWADGDQLGLRGAKGTLTPAIVTQIKEHKTDILRLLSQPVQRYPLSHGQEALWFTAQQAAHSPLYNVSIALRIHSPVDVGALQQTFQTFIVRHPLLRTTFTMPNGKPQQVVHRFQRLAFAQIDAQGWSDAQRDEQVLATHETPFDLEEGPLMRVHLFTRASDDHILLCTMHHIITDGWSMWMLLDEFKHLYTAAQAGSLTAAALAQLPTATRSYADYVTWQQEMVKSEGERLWTYWQKQLAGELPILNLPTDRPRPRVQSYRGASHHFALPAGLAQRIKQLAQREGVTLYTLLMAAFQVFLYRYSGQDDILVGSPTAGRSKPEFAPIVGYFTSPVVVRGNLRGNPSFHDFLGQMRTTVLEALAHQDFPFGLLVERLHLDRDASRPPLYQATFALQKPQQTTHLLNAAGNGVSKMNWGGLLLSPYELGQYQGRVDLMLEMIEAPEALTATFRYSADLFDGTTIEQMAGRFITLLTGIVDAPQQQVTHLPLLTPAERAQILVDWNATEAPYPQDRCVHELFAEQAVRTPDTDALVFIQPQQTAPLPAGHCRLTYRELNQRANQLAHYLQTLDVGSRLGTETRVGICLERSIETVVSILGVLKAGGAYVPLDPAYPQERLAFIMQDAALEVLLTTSAILPTLPATAATVICLDQVNNELAAQCTANPQVMVSVEQLAYMIYTSGSTGLPKGVMVEHRGIPNLAYAQMKAFGMKPDSRVLQYASFSFDASVSELFKTLLAGATLYMADRETLLPGPALVELLKREAITMVTLSPSVLAVLPYTDLPALQSLIVAGEACPVELAQQWAVGRRFLNAYGPTEATVCATVAELTPAAIAAGPRFLSIGQPIDNVQVYILDEHQQPVPPGVPGELYIGGVGVARGYHRRPELTAEKFVTNPFGEGRLYRTGDRACYRFPTQSAAGNGQAAPEPTASRPAIEFLGRIDNQVKLRGFRIELGEIEEVLRRHPSVREAAVLVRNDTPQNPQLVAYVAPHLDTTAVETEQISYWQGVNTQIFGNQPAPADLTFNITGWSSSYTGLPFADDEMREWVEATVATIRALQPNHVLEIGCGTGLLVSRIAPHCQRYVGADFSPEVLRNIEQLRASDPALAHVELQQRTADNFAGIEPHAFDVVILNSVIQYFPSIDYLRRVLQAAVNAGKPGGKIFLGDVRSLPLLAAQQAMIQLVSAGNEITRTQLEQRVQRALQDEEELVIDPMFFLALQRTLPQISDVEIQLKRGVHVNELMQFRYTAILHIGDNDQGDHHPVAGRNGHVSQAPASNPQWLDWATNPVTLVQIEQILTTERPAQLGVRHLPNRRVQKATKVAAWLDSGQEQTVGDLLQQLNNQSGAGIDPEAIWALGEATGYQVTLTWSEVGAHTDGMDVLFSRPGTTHPLAALYGKRYHEPVKPWSAYANNPLQGKLRRQLTPQLTSFLQRKLPDYMVPGTIMLLEALPLNNSGKVDYHALPAPAVQASARERFAPPTTAIEKQLAAVWCEVLQVEQVSLHDDFFELGGSSLQIVQLASAISAAMDRQLTTRELMLNPTVAQLAKLYEEYAQEAAQAAATTANGASAGGATEMALPTAPHIHWEKRSLLSLFVTGKLQPIEGAALSYLSSTQMQKSGLSRDEVVYECFENLPYMSSVMETHLGRIGLITLPRLGAELYHDDEVMSLVIESLEMAGRFGAKVVSLTGLIPSATNYGRAIVEATRDRSDLPQVTTGHATTSATVLLSIQRLLKEAKRDLAKETVGFIGLGSVGMATLHLMLQTMPHPHTIILCDLFSKLATLEETGRHLREAYNYQGNLQIAASHTEAPAELYTASLIVGATNVPNVLDINRVQPGALLVDDSAPHCFDYRQAIQRLQEQEDILFTEGGTLEMPQPLHYQVHVPRQMAPMMQDAQIFRQVEATGCVLSSLLTARYPELQPTVGLVAPETSGAHYARLTELGIRAAALHCREYVLPQRVIRGFRYRFGS